MAMDTDGHTHRKPLTPYKMLNTLATFCLKLSTGVGIGVASVLLFVAAALRAGHTQTQTHTHIQEKSTRHNAVKPTTTTTSRRAETMKKVNEQTKGKSGNGKAA